MEAILLVSLSIMINDTPNGFIISSRGIRQGDPLSPYFLIICMVVLSQSLTKEAFSHKSGIGVKIYPRVTTIPCLLFTYDCLLFCKAQQWSCTRLRNLLESFCTNSGQLINLHKSSLTASKNASNSQKQLVIGIFNIVHTDGLGKYPGCLVF